MIHKYRWAQDQLPSNAAHPWTRPCMAMSGTALRLRLEPRDFPGGLVVKNLSPMQGTWVCTPQLPKPFYSRAHVPQQEKPPHSHKKRREKTRTQVLWFTDDLKPGSDSLSRFPKTNLLVAWWQILCKHLTEFKMEIKETKKEINDTM